MGYMQHHAIVVTCWKAEHLAAAHTKATELGAQVSNIVEGAVNGECSFLIAPDGSKEGWNDSDLGDVRRNVFVDWIRAEAEAGRNYCSWVELSFGGDSQMAVLHRGSDDNVPEPPRTPSPAFVALVEAAKAMREDSSIYRQYPALIAALSAAERELGGGA